MKRRSLRIQITVAVGAIVALACLALTLNSIHSAKSYYVPYLKDAAVPDSSMAVSYTHLDVYKRQVRTCSLKGISLFSQHSSVHSRKRVFKYTFRISSFLS